MIYVIAAAAIAILYDNTPISGSNSAVQVQKANDTYFEYCSRVRIDLPTSKNFNAKAHS